ncbi:hypothetical protein H0266_04585 [Halobacillus locisalis]|uniref:Uncharacterized protein n=1 Tax=Halobacillus locisalis TaxID=220753 RepID=A0A838CRB9_9BACI|nr:hypothetical protein [Halobacillus locisalis]MBA2174176.1 hypothetical protein [Halobacillus locisalis]
MTRTNRRPMNDVMDHMKKVEGVQMGRGGKLPKPIKWIGYILFGSFFLVMLLGLLISYIN